MQLPLCEWQGGSWQCASGEQTFCRPAAGRVRTRRGEGPVGKLDRRRSGPSIDGWTGGHGIFWVRENVSQPGGDSSEVVMDTWSPETPGMGTGREPEDGMGQLGVPISHCHIVGGIARLANGAAGAGHGMVGGQHRVISQR